MADFDPEAYDALFGDDGLFNGVSGFDGYDPTEVASYFQEFQERIKVSFPGISEMKPPVLETDGWHVNFNGKDVNLTEVASDLNPVGNDLNISDVRNSYIDGLKKLGFDPDGDLSQEFINNQTDTFMNSGENKHGGFNNDANAGTNEARENSKLPTDNDSLKENISNNFEDGEEKFNQTNQAFQDAKQAAENGDDSKAKSWYDKFSDGFKLAVKFAMFLALLLAALDLYDFLNKLSHTLSGCFSSNSNGMCKIEALTCNNDDVKYADTMCTPCQKVDCSDIPAGTQAWLPLKLTACTCDATEKSDFPGPYCMNAQTGTNNCGGNNPNCPIPGTNSMNRKREDYSDIKYSYNLGDCSTATVACPNANGCVSKPEACANSSGDNCSEWCSNSFIRTVPGNTVKCQNCDILCAFNHAVGNTLSPLSNIISKILKIFIYIAAGIVAFIVLIFIFKELWAHFVDKDGDGGGKKGNNNVTLTIKTDSGSGSIGSGRKK